MPVQYAGIREEHLAVRRDAGVFDVTHMGEIETRGPQALELPAAPALQRRREDRRRRRAVQRAVPRGRRRPRRPLHLPPRRRPLPDGHERLEPRQGPRLVPAARRAASTSRSSTATRDYAMLAVQGPHARELVGKLTDDELPDALPHRRASTLAGVDAARLRHRLHGRGRRRAAHPARRRRGRLGRPRRRGRRARRPGRARHAAPRGLLPPLRQRPDGGARPDRGRPRLVLQGGHGLHRLRRRPRRARGRARPRSSRRSCSPAPASPARATRSSAAAR